MCVLWHRGNVNAVLDEGVEIGGDDFVGSKVRATQRSQREPERHCKLPSFNDRHPELMSVGAWAWKK